MPINQGSNFNFVTLNPYAFEDWGGVGQAPLNSTRGTYAGPGGTMNFRYPSTVTYTSSAESGKRVFGMHQKAPRSMAIVNGTSVNGQLSQLQSSGCWFNWLPTGNTQFRFQGDNTSYQSGSPTYGSLPASPTNPPFVIVDFFPASQIPGGNARGTTIYMYHGQNAQLLRQMSFASDTGQTWTVYHAGFDGGGNISAWDYEPIAGGSNYQFDQVTQF